MTACENKLWFKVITLKYYQRQSFLETSNKNLDSYTWKGICRTKLIIKQGVCYHIGNGTSISVLKHPWIPGLKNLTAHIKPRIEEMLHSIFVAQLALSNFGQN